MEDLERIELFEELPVPKAIAKLALPTVMSSLVMILYSMADTYFVGILADPIQNAAVALSAPVLLAFNAVNNLFGVGSSSMMSRALGRRDETAARQSSAFGFYSSLCCGLLLSLGCTLFRPGLLALLGADQATYAATAAYMKWTVTFGAAPAILNVVMAYMVRSEGASLHASLGTMSGCLLNMLLDPVFILPWGLNMGAAGAGLATCLSNCVACVYFLILVFVRRGKTVVSIAPGSFTLRRSIILGVFAVGIPAAIQNLLNVTGMTILNNFTSGYGADAVAAMGIVQKANMVPVQIAFGVSQGMMPLVGYNFSSGNYKRMKAALGFVGAVMLPVMILSSLLFYLASGAIVSAFISVESVIAYGTRFLRGFCLAPSFAFLDFLVVGVFQAIGRGKITLVFALLRKVVLEIPFIFLLNRLFPLYGMPYAQFCAELVLACIAMTILFRLFRELQIGQPERLKNQ